MADIDPNSKKRARSPRERRHHADSSRSKTDPIDKVKAELKLAADRGRAKIKRKMRDGREETKKSFKKKRADVKKKMAQGGQKARGAVKKLGTNVATSVRESDLHRRVDWSWIGVTCIPLLHLLIASYLTITVSDVTDVAPMLIVLLVVLVNITLVFLLARINSKLSEGRKHAIWALLVELASCLLAAALLVSAALAHIGEWAFVVRGTVSALVVSFLGALLYGNFYFNNRNKDMKLGEQADCNAQSPASVYKSAKEDIGDLKYNRLTVGRKNPVSYDNMPRLTPFHNHTPMAYMTEPASRASK